MKLWIQGHRVLAWESFITKNYNSVRFDRRIESTMAKGIGHHGWEKSWKTEKLEKK